MPYHDESETDQAGFNLTPGSNALELSVDKGLDQGYGVGDTMGPAYSRIRL